MRMMARVQIPAEAGSRSIQSGTLPKIIEQFVDRWHPEAMYFAPFEGKRTAFFVFDMPDSADLPAMSEPFFMEVNATVDVAPAMNGEDLQRGLSALA